MKKIDVKENEQVKTGLFKVLLGIIWKEDNPEEKLEKALEEALERVDKMAPKTEPAVSKKGKTPKNSELNKSMVGKKESIIKDNKTNYNKDRADEGRERE